MQVNYFFPVSVFCGPLDILLSRKKIILNVKLYILIAGDQRNLYISGKSREILIEFRQNFRKALFPPDTQKAYKWPMLVLYY